MKKLRARTYATAFSGTVMALVFGALWLGAQSFELWSSTWKVSPGEPAPATVRLPGSYFRITMLRNEAHYLSSTDAACPNVVPRGTVIQRAEECAKVVGAFESARRPMGPLRLAGTYSFFLIIGLLLSAYMRREVMGRARWLRCQMAVYLLLTLSAVGSKALLLFTGLPSQVLPVALVPMLSVYFLGRRLSFGVAFASAVIGASMVNFDIGLFLTYLLSGVASVAVIGNRRRLRILFKSGVIAALVAAGATAVMTLVFSGTLNVYPNLISHLDPRSSLWVSALLGGIGAGVGAMIVSPFIGVLVGEVGRGRLLDLQDLDHPLLRKLRERAPSTWEHSRAMANLAEAAAHAIGGNAMLVRVGAYYHDVGKSVRPEYFIENQGGGENPHDKLNPHDSARAIFQHVVEGTKMLREESVPEDVIEFAYSHHGTSLLEFFWHKNLADGNSQELTEADFSYPGHKPVTRETGILMLVDAIEAAARTVDNPEKAAFEGLVQRIVFSKLTQGQLDESGLSLSDIRIVSNNIVDTLVGMYHARIKYPWQTESTGVNVQTGNQGQGTPSQGTPVIDSARSSSVPGAPGEVSTPADHVETPGAAPVVVEAPEPLPEPTPTPVPEQAPIPMQTPVQVQPPQPEQTPSLVQPPVDVEPQISTLEPPAVSAPEPAQAAKTVPAPVKPPVATPVPLEGDGPTTYTGPAPTASMPRATKPMVDKPEE